MGKPIKPHKIPKVNFRPLYEMDRSPQEGIRIHAVFTLMGLDAREMTRKEFAENYFVSQRTIQRWVKRYNELGLEGRFWRTKPPGRKPAISTDLWREIIGPVVDQLTNAEDDTVNVKELHRRLIGLGICTHYETLLKHLKQQQPWINRKVVRDCTDQLQGGAGYL